MVSKLSTSLERQGSKVTMDPTHPRYRVLFPLPLVSSLIQSLCAKESLFPGQGAFSDSQIFARSSYEGFGLDIENVGCPVICKRRLT